jgi:alpha-L-rhamnosidase
MGVPIFTEWATKARQSDLVATILRQPDYPGYLYMIANGATATWESWDSERSRVHNCYNGIGTWFYQALAGIRPDEHAPGYRHFYVDPQPTGGVSWVKATKPTPYGEIRVEIGADGRLSLVVPVGTTATVYPKSSREQTFGAGRWQIDPAL